MDEERFIVIHHPRAADTEERQPFSRKGLAFAYVKKRLPRDVNGAIGVERQVLVRRTWKPTDLWQFFQNGNIEHSRST